MNHQHPSTSNQAGTNSYSEVPNSAPKEGRTSPLVPPGRCQGLLRSQFCLAKAETSGRSSSRTGTLGLGNFFTPTLAMTLPAYAVFLRCWAFCFWATKLDNLGVVPGKRCSALRVISTRHCTARLMLLAHNLIFYFWRGKLDLSFIFYPPWICTTLARAIADLGSKHICRMRL